MKYHWISLNISKNLIYIYIHVEQFEFVLMQLNLCHPDCVLGVSAMCTVFCRNQRLEFFVERTCHSFRDVSIILYSLAGCNGTCPAHAKAEPKGINWAMYSWPVAVQRLLCITGVKSDKDWSGSDWGNSILRKCVRATLLTSARHQSSPSPASPSPRGDTVQSSWSGQRIFAVQLQGTGLYLPDL